MYSNKDRNLISLEAGGRKRERMRGNLIGELMRFISYLPAHDQLVAQKHSNSFY